MSFRYVLSSILTLPHHIQPSFVRGERYRCIHIHFIVFQFASSAPHSDRSFEASLAESHLTNVCESIFSQAKHMCVPHEVDIIRRNEYFVDVLVFESMEFFVAMKSPSLKLIISVAVWQNRNLVVKGHLSVPICINVIRYFRAIRKR